MSKAKCPECKLLFESSFENKIQKSCPCCGYIGSIEEFICKEDEWVKKEGFKKEFLSSLKKKGEERELNKLAAKKRGIKGKLEH